MQNHILSIIVGIVMVLVVGTTVYKTNTPVIPQVGDLSLGNTERSDDVESEDEDDRESGNTAVGLTPTTAPAPVQTSGGIKLAEVARHNTRASCWSAINDNVYDLTSWIPNHPGGEQRILSLCGIDGSSAFNGQHGGSAKPTTILAGFKVWVLAK